ncbi:Schizosaccharomyces pombe specific protein Mug150 [Schizosaccharomyces pombe]|uniref:Meiotically up-regulated gene 150 protein n=1 Tax=Schizosaccharomyces pombe (strain 972 / ATCC 24843) TaxID=284812 RepID=MU150_SCHPO|nr:protein mug150 [Schizosaccharomyces pombe]O94546.1 RecName: Full=Meiotically up-regulated gene 150 protein [Schizosaccharomyces pombe 972h-]CAA22860.1 sequence orphan [Schizosaccharomyces pombe]|eukprot:NP_588135.1 protein mug150 [Schizosaccharomyces pombe]
MASLFIIMDKRFAVFASSDKPNNCSRKNMFFLKNIIVLSNYLYLLYKAWIVCTTISLCCDFPLFNFLFIAIPYFTEILYNDSSLLWFLFVSLCFITLSFQSLEI